MMARAMRVRLTDSLPICCLLYAILLAHAGCTPLPGRALRPDGLTLTQLKQNHGLSGKRISHTHRYTLTGRGHQVILAAGIRRMLVDGRFQQLPFAPYYAGDSLVVPKAIAEYLKAKGPAATLKPVILKPDQALERFTIGPVRLSTVVIDAGHGGRDPGASGPAGLKEKTVTLAVAKEVARLLRAADVNVIMTRTGDNSYPSLATRARTANGRAPDLFVSIHADAVSGKPRVSGVETFVMDHRHSRRTTAWRARRLAAHYAPAAFDPSASRTRNRRAKQRAFERILKRNHWRQVRAAQAVQSAMVDILGETDRGVKRANFHVLRETAVPAILVETGFISNPETERRMRKSEYCKRIARAIVIGIARYSRR